MTSHVSCLLLDGVSCHEAILYLFEPPRVLPCALDGHQRGAGATFVVSAPGRKPVVTKLKVNSVKPPRPR